MEKEYFKIKLYLHKKRQPWQMRTDLNRLLLISGLRVTKEEKKKNFSLE